jgi:hypothetical protein
MEVEEEEGEEGRHGRAASAAAALWIRVRKAMSKLKMPWD